MRPLALTAPLRLAFLLLLLLSTQVGFAQRGRERPEIRPEDRESIARMEQQLAESRWHMHLGDIESEAGQKIAELTSGLTDESPRFFVTHLGEDEFAAHFKGATRAWAFQQGRKGVPTKEEVRSLLDSPIADRREKYIRLLEAEQARFPAEWIAGVTPFQLQSFQAFVRLQQGDSARIDEETERKYVGAYLRSEQQRQGDLEAEFPVINPNTKFMVLDELLQPPEGEDAHEFSYTRRAFQSYVDRDPVLRRLDLKDWRFSGTQFGDLTLIAEAMHARLPGGQPEVMFFLDPAVGTGATNEMSAAWRRTGRSNPRFLDHADLDQLMEGMRGKTLVLIGHIEEQAFVMNRGPGRPMLTMDIPAANRAALAHDVLFIPLGCNSMAAGASFGFLRPISSSEVASFLEAVPPGDLIIGDFLRAFRGFGDVYVDASKLQQFLEIAVRHVAESDRSGAAPIVVVRLPAGLMTPAPSTVTTRFAAYADDWNKVNRAWYDQGRWAAISASYRASHGLIAFLLGGVCFFVAGIVTDIQRLRVHLRAWALSLKSLRIISETLAFGLLLLGMFEMRAHIIMAITFAWILMTGYGAFQKSLEQE